MISDIKGLHHVTSIASDPARNNAFFTDVLGLRRVKKTVNFDAPDVYHLYYGDSVGSPSTVMTYFPFPNAAGRTRGTGEVGRTQFAVPKGSLPFWSERLADKGVQGLEGGSRFGSNTLAFLGPDQDEFSLIEIDAAADPRAPWLGSDISEEVAIRGFEGVEFRLADAAATSELLGFMGYEKTDSQDGFTRYSLPQGDQAVHVDVQDVGQEARARQGAGSVHHVAFAVEDRAAQLRVREALIDTGYNVTPVIDRNYFWAIYFRTPGGILFEVATNEPGFENDEAFDQLGQGLKLPEQHEWLREKLEQTLQPLEA